MNNSVKMRPQRRLTQAELDAFLEKAADFLRGGGDHSELQISQSEFARTIGLSPMRISHVVKGKRPVTAEMALLFGKAFGQTPQYWINLQVEELDYQLN